MIGPTIAQLPEVDRVAVCRKLVQFLEMEEARLVCGLDDSTYGSLGLC